MRIAISGINANDNPGPGLGLARSLKESGEHFEILGISYDPNDSGHYLKQYFDQTTFFPFPGKGWGELKRKLRALNKENQIDLLIPCLDAELPLYIQHQEEIEKELGIHLFLPTMDQFNERGKNRLGKLSKKLGAKYPKTIEVNSPDDMRRAVDDSFAFPFLVKGKYYKAYRVNTFYEAMLRFEEIANEWGYPVLLQKVVTGVEVNLVGVADGKGNLLGSVAIKKLTTTSLGKIWTAVTIKNEALQKMATEFVQVTKWKGPFELECIAGNKGLYLIEINPRFPAWAYFATACGINLPLRLIEYLKGRKVFPANEYALGRLLIRFCGEIVTDWAVLTQFQSSLTHDDEAKSKKAA